MFKNRNGYWMSPGFFALFAPDGGDGGSGAGAAGDGATGGDGGEGTSAGNAAGNGDNGGDKSGDGDDGGDNSADALNAEIARLKAEIAKQKNAITDATKEAAKYKRELQSRKTQEEIDADAKAEAAEKTAKELEELRKQVAKGNTVKTVMGKLGLDEEAAGNLADHLYGAADIDNALLEIQKAWQAKEAALRKEFGRVTGPGAGADSNSPEAQAIRKAQELGKSRNAVNEQAQKAMQAYLR